MSTMITNDIEAFSHVYDHLLNQKEPAKDSGSDCQYRGHLESTLNYIRSIVEESLDYDNDEYEDELFQEVLCKTPQDAKCAIGSLIQDTYYQYYFEGNVIEESGVIMEAVKKSNPIWKVTDMSYKMMRRLQEIHDNNHPENWENLLENLKNNFDKYGDYTESKEVNE